MEFQSKVIDMISLIAEPYCPQNFQGWPKEQNAAYFMTSQGKMCREMVCWGSVILVQERKGMCIWLMSRPQVYLLSGSFLRFMLGGMWLLDGKETSVWMIIRLKSLAMCRAYSVSLSLPQGCQGLLGTISSIGSYDPIPVELSTNFLTRWYLVKSTINHGLLLVQCASYINSGWILNRLAERVMLLSKFQTFTVIFSMIYCQVREQRNSQSLAMMVCQFLVIHTLSRYSQLGHRMLVRTGAWFFWYRCADESVMTRQIRAISFMVVIILSKSIIRPSPGYHKNQSVKIHLR